MKYMITNKVKEPRKLNKIEAPFTAKLKIWMKYNMKFTYGWEVKYPKKETYYFSQDKSFPKELRNLLLWSNVMIYKFSDASQMGTIHDGFTAWDEKAFFFFTWNGKRFYAIDAQTIGELIDDGRKSIDEKMCAVIADVTGILK